MGHSRLAVVGATISAALLIASGCAPGPAEDRATQQEASPATSPRDVTETGKARFEIEKQGTVRVTEDGGTVDFRIGGGEVYDNTIRIDLGIPPIGGWGWDASTYPGKEIVVHGGGGGTLKYADGVYSGVLNAASGGNGTVVVTGLTLKPVS